jgi:hypothetical protein
LLTDPVPAGLVNVADKFLLIVKVGAVIPPIALIKNSFL